MTDWLETEEGVLNVEKITETVVKMRKGENRGEYIGEGRKSWRRGMMVKMEEEKVAPISFLKQGQYWNILKKIKNLLYLQIV